MRWTWDENKNRINTQKHGLRFETAQRVFDDPLIAHRPDPYEGGGALAHDWCHRGGGRGCGAHLAHTRTRNRCCSRTHHQRSESNGTRKESL